MTREHTPKPGAYWQTVPVLPEAVIGDGPWGGPVHVAAWGDKVPAGPPPWRPLSQPANRAARRAARQAGRKKGNLR